MLTESQISIKYRKEIEKLTGNSRLIIDFLTKLAKSNLQHAPIIVNIINHRLEQTKPEWKLLVLYLIDSILKNIGQPFIDLFARNIVEQIHQTFVKVPEATRLKLIKLRKTWKKIFPLRILSEIDDVYSQNAASRSKHVAAHSITSSPISSGNSPSTYSPTNDFIAESLHEIAMSEAQIREHILQREKELLELRKKKFELQIKVAKEQLEGETELCAAQQLEGVIMDQILTQQYQAIPAIDTKPQQKPEAGVDHSGSPNTASLSSNSPQHSPIRPLNVVTAPAKQCDKVVNERSLEDKENKPEKKEAADDAANVSTSQLIDPRIISSPHPSECSESNDSTKYMKEEDEEMSPVKEEKAKISSSTVVVVKPPPIDISFDKMKERRVGLIDQLFTGMKCTSCGIRFPVDQRDKYSEHLDWHFRENRRKRSRSAKILSRKWYCSYAEWFLFIEFEDAEERAPSIFESQAVKEKECSSSKKKKVLDGMECTLPSSGHDRTISCPHCNEGFDLFYDQESEEWRFKNAGLDTSDGVAQVFHAQCLQDYYYSSDIEGASSSFVSTAVDDNSSHVGSTLVKKEEDVESLKEEKSKAETIVASKNILEVEVNKPPPQISDDMMQIDNDESSEQMDIICLSESVKSFGRREMIELETGEKVYETTISNARSSPHSFRVTIEDAVVNKKLEPPCDDDATTNNDRICHDEVMNAIVQERKCLQPKPRLDQNIDALRNCTPKISGMEVSGLCTIC